MNEIQRISSIDNKYIGQVKSFGALGYTPDKILELLNLPKTEAAELRIRIGLPGDDYYKAYHQGYAIGEYNIDVELHKQSEKGDIDSIKLEEERNMLRREEKLRRDLFGV